MVYGACPEASDIALQHAPLLLVRDIQLKRGRGRNTLTGTTKYHLKAIALDQVGDIEDMQRQPLFEETSPSSSPSTLAFSKLSTMFCIRGA